MSVTIEGGSAARQRAQFESLYGKTLRDVLSQYAATWDMCNDDMLLAGSQYVVGSGNDVDVVIVTNDLNEYAQRLDDAGWTIVAAEVYRGIDSDGWFSAKRGEFNLLVSEKDIAELWVKSSEACWFIHNRYGGCTTRDERVEVHRIIWGEA